MINCDSQAAIRAIDSTVIKNSTTLEATMALNTLGESNEITLRWIAAHYGYEGNELTDQLTKRGSNNDRPTRIKLPKPHATLRLLRSAKEKDNRELDRVVQAEPS